ncbi:transcriptional regulator [Kitasatospora herbaricolor]|uniref:GlxA family transcriptional regulator n=1 Tax=Kitasatospora herbaricolor TaxID=68217 RepID=UPI00174E5FE7|nr:helix-turn-helix domain-containing protein [Kitasatospora herbaricolor]MDQ0310145.1 transcriptional regulator GlxA family with amidase domain [Kitasatospora herbaricolor]GGV18045.1 transcriptional regulator [Kitasatospora herbaricolor]
MSAAHRGAPHRVAVLALDRVIAFELAIPSRIFESAKAPDGAPLYQVDTCTLDGGPVATSSDFRISVDHGPELLERADTVVIPAAAGITDAWATAGPPPGTAAALARVRPGTRLVSICTGAFVLAAAGLLDGRPATTHWRHTEQFAALFPQVRLDPDVLFTDDGDVLTSGGVAAGVDLCLHLVRRDHGSAVANAVARTCIVPPWREGGQKQYVEMPRPVTVTAGPGTAAVRAWALEHLDEPLALRELAARAGTSVRTFTRRFREETGSSPGQWLTLQRTERARQLLERTDLTIDQVARESGFGTAASLRLQLRGRLDVAPSAYRRTFREVGGPRPA